MSRIKSPISVLIMHLGGETTCGDQKRNVDVFNFGGASCLANTDVGKKIDWQNLHPVYSVDHLLREINMLTAIRKLRMGGLEDLYMY